MVARREVDCRSVEDVVWSGGGVLSSGGVLTFSGGVMLVAEDCSISLLGGEASPTGEMLTFCRLERVLRKPEVL